MQKRILFFLSLFLTFVVGATAATVSVPTAMGEYIDWNDASLTNAKVENGGKNIGSTHAGSVAQFTLQNEATQNVILTFKSGASKLTAVLNATIKTADGTEVINNDFDIANTGSWSLSDVHTLAIPDLPKGTLTFTLTVKSTTASYAGNYGDLAFYSEADYYANYPQVPSDDFFPLIAGSYTSYGSTNGGTAPRYEESSQNVGYVVNGGTATYTFYASQKAYYNLSMGITTINGGSIQAKVVDKASGATEASGTFAIPSSSNYAQQSFEFANFISTGVKELQLTFVNEKEFIMNYKNITLTKRADIPGEGAYYNVTVSQNIAEAGKVTQTPSGKLVREGSNVKFTAKPNFGYCFKQWVDGSGAVLSTANPYTHRVMSDLSITAVFETVNTYELNVVVDGGGYEGMVSVSPEPTVVGTKNMYEEGTEVKLTASENEAVTFNYWSDGTTSKDLTITMDGNKTITATYSQNDYVVAWDLHNTSKAQPYTADFYSTPENNEAGLYIRNYTTGNIDAGRGMWVRDGGMATIWGLPIDYAFEIHYDATNFTTMRVKANLWYSYNYWEKVLPQWSTDAKNWQSAGEAITMTTSRTTHEFTLPATADHQANIYFRFMPDTSSTLLNAGASDYRPIWISDIYVFGQQQLVDDGQAPKFLSSVPADGASGASASGRIVLTFDEKVKLNSNASATLGGTAISGSAAGKSLVFPYSALKYNTTYQFKLAAGSVADQTGNTLEQDIVVNFTTMERKQPEARLYDAIVAQDGSGNYTTVSAALNAAPSNSATPWLIFIKAGTYEEQIHVTKPHIHLVGEGRNKVKLTWYGLSGDLGNDTKAQADQKGVKYELNGTAKAGPSFWVQNNDFYAEGIEFENSWGMKMLNGPQALAVTTQKDRAIFNKVGMSSYQDTYYSNSPVNTRAFVKDSYITGAVDFIYGGSEVYFENDTLDINRPSGGFIVAPSHDATAKYGYVFNNTTITTSYTRNPEDYSVWLGRPWHGNPKTVFLHTKMEVTPNDSLWYATMGGLPAIWAVYDLTDKAGNPRSTVSRQYYYRTENGKRVWGKAKNTISDEEASQYTIANVMRGNDDWQPEVICEQTSKPEIASNGGLISWQPVEYSICYVVLKDGYAYDFTKDTKYACTETGTYTVKAASEYGVLSDASNAVEVSEITGISQISTNATAFDTPKYNLGGQRVNGNYHGVVVQKGRKFVIK